MVWFPSDPDVNKITVQLKTGGKQIQRRVSVICSDVFYSKCG